jgi:hypothetical protein
MAIVVPVVLAVLLLVVLAAVWLRKRKPATGGAAAAGTDAGGVVASHRAGADYHANHAFVQQTAVWGCQRPAPSGANCKNKVVQGKQYCKGHSCPDPACKESKSSKEAACAAHQRRRSSGAAAVSAAALAAGRMPFAHQGDGDPTCVTQSTTSVAGAAAAPLYHVVTDAIIGEGSTVSAGDAAQRQLYGGFDGFDDEMDL